MIKKSFIFLVAETYLIEEGENFSFFKKNKKKFSFYRVSHHSRQLHPHHLSFLLCRAIKRRMFISPEKLSKVKKKKRQEKRWHKKVKSSQQQLLSLFSFFFFCLLMFIFTFNLAFNGLYNRAREASSTFLGEGEKKHSSTFFYIFKTQFLFCKFSAACYGIMVKVKTAVEESLLQRNIKVENKIK